MAKDPAFIFYSSDFITGTMFMSNEQVGIYIRLLCAQHQHGGLISKNSFNSIVGENDVIREKFVEVEDGFYNERLLKEMGARLKKSSSLSENAKKRWEKINNYDANAMQLHNKSTPNAMQGDMPPEDESVFSSLTKILNGASPESTKNLVMVVVEMMKIWVQAKPGYVAERDVDYPALLKIAYYIAEKKGWKKSEVISQKEFEVLKSWQKIVDYLTSETADNFFKRLTLDGVANLKNLQKIVEAMRVASEPGKIEKKRVKPTDYFTE